MENSRLMRRVVTAVGSDGRSFVADDRLVEPVTVAAMPGYAWHRLWSLDELPAHPAPASQVCDPDHFAPPGGIRFYLYEIPPGEVVVSEISEAHRHELEAKLPGRASHMEDDQGGTHATRSLDLVFVVQGEITLLLDDGAAELGPGDTVVQNGARHAWRNRSDAPCRMAVWVIGLVGA
jgi:hypothetical protein